MEANLADLFELAVDHFGDREYVVASSERRTYAEMEDRANRLAHHLRARGVRPGDHVGIYAYNSVEWVESLWAIFKLRAVFININYRYVADELRYLFTNADLVGLIHAREFSDRVASVADAMPMVRFSVVIDDGTDVPYPRADSVPYESAIAGAPGGRDFGPRSPDDHYILYTGGTTGMPKGVVWRHEDVFYALGGGINLTTNEQVADPSDLVLRVAASGGQLTSLPIAPLMHGASQWSVMGGSFQGSKVVLVPRFDPREVWRLVGAERVNLLFITGDAMARPLIEALDEAGASYDTSSLFAMASTAALFSPSLKDAFLERFPNLVVSDAFGASETGGNGHTVVKKGSTAMKGGPTVNVVSGTVVLDEELNEVAPGSGIVGKVARRGFIPLGYYNDPAKTAETFITAPDGRRYAMPGDYALVEPDGAVTLLGRGSVSINSGGEKIYPEEVEAAVRSHPAVWDATVVGAPDERWGQRVVAIVSLRDGATLDLEALQAHCRESIAGYKVPRTLLVVDEIARSPSGKPDYRWAAAVAGAEAPPAGASAGTSTGTSTGTSKGASA
jgi:acyl-CoA synthetase (AMP-forming)/AMP-acid ligase II